MNGKGSSPRHSLKPYRNAEYWKHKESQTKHRIGPAEFMGKVKAQFVQEAQVAQPAIKTPHSQS